MIAQFTYWLLLMELWILLVYNSNFQFLFLSEKEHWGNIAGAGFEGVAHDDEREEIRSDEDNSEGDKKAKKGSFKKRAISAGNNFRHSLKRKSKKKSDNIVSIEDIRDVQEVETVARFRRCLLDGGLLPERYDDYHMMLRYHICCSQSIFGFLG